MRLYKLTDPNGVTRAREPGETQWGENVTHTAIGDGNELCTFDVIHAYLTPELAILLNPIHADFSEPILWEAEGEIVAREGDIKVGCKSLTTLRRLPLVEPTLVQRIAFGILCAKAVYSEPSFVAWADKWLSGEDRCQAAAQAAAEAAEAAWAAWAATWAATGGAGGGAVGDVGGTGGGTGGGGGVGGDDD